MPEEANATSGGALPGNGGSVDGSNDDLCVDEAVERPSPAAAAVRARVLAEKGCGITVSRTGAPEGGDWADAVILTRIGDMPTDLELASGV